MPVNAPDDPAQGLVSRTVTDDWEQALITGNGRQGALCYGGPGTVRITVSHERLFLPLHPPLDAPDTAAILPRLRALLFAGEYARAAELVCESAAAAEPGYATLRWIDPLIAAATLTLTPMQAGKTTGYRRSTDFTTGVVTQHWHHATGAVTVETFVSRPDDVVVVRMRADGGALASVLRLAPVDGEPPRPIAFHTVARGGVLTLRGTFTGRWPEAIAGYAVACRAIAIGGSATVEGDTLRVRGAQELVVLVRTSVAAAGADNEVDRAAQHATAAVTVLGTDVDTLRKAHASVHGELFGRIRLSLDSAGGSGGDTEDLITGPPGPALVERLFDAGRYAIISSCGELPPTLQGVWSGSFNPAWSSGFTVNGNLQSAVAALLATRTPELLLPVFDLLDRVHQDLRDNARRLYGAGGILTPTHLSTHGRQNHFGPVWCQTFWTAGAAWLARLYYDYWRYTGDRDFLAGRALPFLREAARFYLDFAVERSGGHVFAPSVSPENHPANTGSQASINATMDVAAVADLLRNLLTVTAELGVEDPDEPRWRRLLHGLPPLPIAETGELAEWAWPGLDDNHAHRHASQLYPLWYEPDPAVITSPGLRTAAQLAVRRRLQWWRGAESAKLASRPESDSAKLASRPGSEADEMAYGLVQLGLAAAQLGLAGDAYEALALLAGRYWRPSLVSTHNRGALFNVDICGGLPALVLAMLARGAYGRLDLLPALPPAWPRGRVQGVAVRDQIVVEHLAWTADHLEAVLRSARNQQFVLGLPAGARLTELIGARDQRRTTDGSVAVAVAAGVPVRVRAERGRSGPQPAERGPDPRAERGPGR